MKSILYILLTLLIGSLYLYSCANKTAPTGGPKDTIPPRLINAIPKDKSLNFRGDKIVLVFDEFIKTKDLTNQLIVTPRLGEGAFTHKINKTTLTLDLNEKLDSNTTYTFYFQESVQDINESTPARDLVLAFSTGDYIDSLMIEGRVIDLLNNKPLENIVVALYPAGDTLDIFNSKPQYFTRSKKGGEFRIENLKNASYRIYAFDDKNKNLIAQSDSEPYGFISDTIQLDSSISDVTIPLIKRNVKPFMIQSARPNGVYYEIKMNKFIDSYEVTTLTDEVDSVVSNFLPDQNTVRFYNTLQVDSVKTRFVAVDTIGQQFIDTVTVKWTSTQRKPDPASVEILPTSNSSVDPSFEASIIFNKPTTIINLDSAFIYYDSLTIDSIRREELTWNKFHDKLTIKKTLDPTLLIQKTTIDSLANQTLTPDTLTQPVLSQELEGEIDTPQSERDKRSGRQKQDTPAKSKFSKTDTQIILYFAQGSFISVEKDTIPEILSLYNFKEKEETALYGTLETEYEYFIIQLLDKNFQVVDEIKNKKSFRFEEFPPGDYHLRILIDNDQDGEWFPGNILENRSPEDVYFYTKPLIINYNWHRDLEKIVLESDE